MINYWKINGGLTEINKFEEGCWMNVVNPSNQEKEILINDLQIPEDFILDILDVDERSRTELEDNWLLIIIRIPIYNKYNKIPYYTIPLGVLVSGTTLITVCITENEIINDFINPQKNKKINIDTQSNFILEIFFRSATLFLKYLKLINIQTMLIEKDLEKSTKNKELNNLLKMEKCLVYFITSLKSNELLLLKLQHARFAKNLEFDPDFLEDVYIENKQAIEMANIYSDIQSGLMDAFASVISNNLNVVMKQLTSITIILMIPTLVSSIYGMNVPNYFENNKYAFLIIIGISAFFVGMGMLIFRKRDLF